MLGKLKSGRLLWALLIAAELVVMFTAYFIYDRREIPELSFTQEDFVYDTGEAGFYLDKSSGRDCVSTPELTLQKGWYTLDIQCEYARELTSRLEIIYADEEESSISDGIPLNEAYSMSYDFGIKDSGRPFYIRARLSGDAEEGDYILLRGAKITLASYDTKNRLLNIAALFLLADLLLLLFFAWRRLEIDRQTRVHIRLLIIVIFISSIPLMNDYLGDTHDLGFHLMRIEGLADGLEAGRFPVKIQPGWLDGHGYAVSVFYGDVLLYIPALLRICGMPVSTVYKLYILSANIATAFISYRCFSKIGGRRAALICTIVYTLNIYRLCCIYTRGALGEYTAMVFMPLVLYGLWAVYTLPEGCREHKKSWIYIAAGCTGIFLSHMISAEITAFFIIVTALFFFRRTFSKKTFTVLLKAAAAAVCLNLWFLTPFLDYMLSGTYVINNPDAYTPYGIENYGVFWGQLFMNDYSTVGDSANIDSGVDGEMPLTVGYALLCALFGWFLLCFGRKGRSNKEKTGEYFAAALCGLSLLMSLCVFPYTWLAGHIPFLKFPIRSFQFPWRFLTAAALLLTYLLCLVLKKKWLGEKKKTLFAFLLVILSLAQGISYLSKAMVENEVIHPRQSTDVSTRGVHGAEYIPVEAGKEQEEGYRSFYVNELTFDENSVRVDEWHREDCAVVVTLENISDEAAQVEVPLLLYKYYSATADDGSELMISPGEAYRISVSVPAGFKGSFKVEFKEPWHWRACEVFSLAALIWVICAANPNILNKVKKNSKLRKSKLAGR